MRFLLNIALLKLIATNFHLKICFFIFFKSLFLMNIFCDSFIVLFNACLNQLGECYPEKGVKETDERMICFRSRVDIGGWNGFHGVDERVATWRRLPWQRDKPDRQLSSVVDDARWHPVPILQSWRPGKLQAHTRQNLRLEPCGF